MNTQKNQNMKKLCYVSALLFCTAGWWNAAHAGSGKTINSFSAMGTTIQQVAGNGQDTTVVHSGTYSGASGSETVLFQSGETVHPMLHETLNSWVKAHLTGIVPFYWQKPDSFSLESGIVSDTVFAEDMLFPANVTLSVAAGKSVTFNGSGTQQLGKVRLTNLESSLKFGPKATLGTIKELSFDRSFDPYDASKDVLYNNFVSPFPVLANTVGSLSSYSMDAGSRASTGVPASGFWVKKTGADVAGSRIDLQAQPQCSTATFASSDESAIKDYLFGKTDSLQLEYDYGVNGKDALWKKQHFGWNEVHSMLKTATTVSFSDPSIRYVQCLQKNGNYLPIKLDEGSLLLQPYTAYQVQTQMQNTVMRYRSGSTSIDMSHPVLCVDLIDDAQNVLDRLYLTAGVDAPGLCVEKLGKSGNSLYTTDSVNQYCAGNATFENDFATFQLNVNQTAPRKIRFTSFESNTLRIFYGGKVYKVNDVVAASSGKLQILGVNAVGLVNEQSGVDVYARNHELVVEGLVAGSTFRVYNISGMLLHERQSDGSVTTLSNLDKGVYIVRIGYQSYKVLMP